MNPDYGLEKKAFALCFVIFTAFTGLVSVNVGPGALYESHTFSYNF